MREFKQYTVYKVDLENKTLVEVVHFTQEDKDTPMYNAHINMFTEYENQVPQTTKWQTGGSFDGVQYGEPVDNYLYELIYKINKA
jgi:hypothetical protein